MSRADNAKAVLDNDEFKRAFQRIENDLLNGLRNVGMNDADTQRSLTLSIQLLSRIEKHLTSLLNDDKIKEFNAKQRKLKTGNG